jgi:hypothetical protein
MTPKGKSKDLIDRLGIESAIAVVEEMIDCAKYIWGGHDSDTGILARDSYKEYWTEVKQEILKEKTQDTI